MAGALNGIRVIELSRTTAAPLCGKLLAGFGAEVIKAEPPGCGDPARAASPFKDDIPEGETSAPFLFLNTGKLSITLDPSSESGRDILMRLLADADVFLEDLGPLLLRELHLEYADLARVNPRLIHASLSCYGQDGPYSNFKGSELTSFALSGFMHITGLPEREPLRAGFDLAQYQGGLHAATGIMAALLHRNLTGEGQFLDVSAAESALYAASMLGPWLNSGDNYARAGSRHPTRNMRHGYPTNVLPCKNGWVHLHYPSGGNELIAMLLEEPKLLEPPFLDEPLGHADEFDALCLPWLSLHDKAEIVQRAQDLRLPFTAVMTPEDVLDDPQHQERGFFIEVEHPRVGFLKQVGAPVKAAGTPWQAARAPLLGEHNRAIYVERLGYSPEELTVLRDRGVI